MKSKALIISVILMISYYVNGQEKWTCYTDKEELLMDNHLTIGIFDHVDGSLWIVTNKGVNIFKDGSWTIINKKTDLMKNKIGSYMVDSQDRVWIGTGTPDMFFDGYLFGQLYDGGIMIYDEQEWKPMNTTDMGIKTPVITEMFEASNGDIWLGVSGVKPGAERGALFAKGALVRYSNGEWTVYKNKDMPCSDCHFVKEIYEDDNGRVFFFADSGIYYFEEGTFHSIRKDNEDFSFSGATFISARFTDSKNNLWLGAPARIAKYDGTQWRSFNRKNGLPSMENPPYGFNETSEGQILMTALNGLYYYDNNGQWVKEKMKLVFGNSYFDAENRHWIPLIKGLLIRDGKDETFHKDMPRVWKIIEDNDGGVWALTRNKGVKRYKDGEWQLFNEDNQLPSNRVNLAYVSDNGTVWLATNKGICSCEYD